jgi:hypothetical protein
MAHLGLNLLDALRPCVLEEFTEVTLDLIDVFLHCIKHFFFFLKAGRFAGLSNRSFCHLVTFVTASDLSLTRVDQGT